MPDALFTITPPSRYLSLLSKAEFDDLAPLFTLIHCEGKQVLGERGAPIEFVYFPCGAVLSTLALMQGGQAVEVGTIGDEGFHGVEALIGGTHWMGLSLCQVSGPVLRMGVADFQRAVQPGTALHRIAYQYLRVFIASMAQSVACNRLHTIEERFARWVLMTHDRVHSDEFDLTQEFLADMLGVHRPSVSLVAGAFQQAGFIKYSRGAMTILNREGLEEASCECYASNAAQFARLMAQ